MSRILAAALVLALGGAGCEKASAPASAPAGGRPSVPEVEVPPTGNGLRAVQIAMAEGHACARMADGTVRCWGSNMTGELGDGTTTERHIPVLVKGIHDAVDIVTGLSYACARLAGGGVRCWGGAGFFRFDDKTQRSDTADDSAGITRFWVNGGSDGCARWSSGQTKCWGSQAGFLAAGHQGTYGTYPEPVVRALEDATDFAFNETLGCARMRDGTVQCFGRNEVGQVGDGSTVMRLDPVVVPGLSRVKQISVGREFACALAETGTVSCWGGNHAGQLGDGTTTENHEPRAVPGVRNVVELVSGSLHTCARHETGTVSCWGWNQYGQLGIGAPSDHSGPMLVPGLTHVTQLAATMTHTCALHEDGNVSCWGQGWRGVLGDGLQTSRAAPVAVKWSLEPKRSAGLPPGVHVRSVAVGAFMSCANLDDGTARCWGSNQFEDIVPGLPASIATPVVIPNLAHALALSLEGRPSARLDDGTVVQWGKAKAVAPVPGLDHVAQYVGGGMVSCVRFDDGRARCEGYKIAPGITLDKVTAIDVEHATACALLEDRTVTCAGYNGKGQLGDGARIGERETFGPVKGLRDVVQISLGIEHACARLADGTVKCWGESMGAGNGDGIQDVPKAVAGLKDAVDIDAGGSASCARLRGGAVKCWGRYDFGSGMDAARTPVEVPWLRGVTSLALGMFHSCAVGAGGEVLCWGENKDGELGDGTNDARSVAAPVRW